MKKFTIYCSLILVFLLFTNASLEAPEIAKRKRLPFPDNYPYDADATLMVSHTKFNIVGLDEYTMYSFNGVFYTQTGDTASKHGIGEVTVNNYDTFFDNDSTYKMYGMDLADDLSFTWIFDDPTGNPGQIQFTTTKSLFNMNNINLNSIDTVINRSNGFYFSHPSITADSVIYVLASDTLKVQKTIIGTSTGVNFSSADLSVLPASDTGGFFIIVYNTMPFTQNGKKYYFQNNSTAIKGIIHVN